MCEPVLKFLHVKVYNVEIEPIYVKEQKVGPYVSNNICFDVSVLIGLFIVIHDSNQVSRFRPADC